jgi:Ca2+/Na+ antiporter
MVDETNQQLVVAFLAIGIVLTFAYSLLIAGQILLWVSIVSTLLFFYLLWRFVRAHERIADALENGEW